MENSVTVNMAPQFAAEGIHEIIGDLPHTDAEASAYFSLLKELSDELSAMRSRGEPKDTWSIEHDKKLAAIIKSLKLVVDS